MIKKRPYHGKIVIETEIYFLQNHGKHLVVLVLSRRNNDGIAPGTLTDRSFREFAYDKSRAQKCKTGAVGYAVRFKVVSTGPPQKELVI